MTFARTSDVRDIDMRTRVQSYAMWRSVVFTLNVLAFPLTGMQARSIVLRMQGVPSPQSLYLCRFYQSGGDLYPAARGSHLYAP